MVDQTVFWCVSLGLQSPEEGLFSSKNLNCRGGVFRQVGQRSSMTDQSRSNGVSDQSSQVGSNESHLLGKVDLKGFAVSEEVDDTVGEVGDVEVVNGGNISSHGSSGSVENVSGKGIVVLEDFGESVEGVFSEGSLVTNELDNLGILVVV